MAQAKYQVQLDFITNKPSLNNVQNQIKQTLALIDTKGIEIGLDQGSINDLKTDLNNISNIISQNFNKNTNKIDFSKVRHQLDIAGTNVNKLDNQLKMMGVNGANSLGQITRAGYIFEKQIKQTNKTVDSLRLTLLNTLKWNISSSAINSISAQFAKAYYFAKDLDRSLNNIRIVSGQTADQMIDFATAANKAALTLKSSTVEYTDAALVYFQQGLNSEDVQKMAEATLIGANIAGESTIEMSNLLTATLNGYQLAAEDAMMVTDKFAAVGASTAADFYELATAMSKVSSMANAAGVPIDQLNAQLATIVSVTKEAPESIGTSLKTIYGRMLAFKNNSTELMEDEDGELFGAPAVEGALEKFSKATGQIISLFETTADGKKQLRDLGDVINEIGNAWQETTDTATKFGLATALAGSRQQNRLVALFDSWDMYRAAVQTSSEAEGTALEQQKVYTDSLESSLKVLRTTAEGIFLNLFRSDDLKVIVDGLVEATRVTGNLLDNLGNIPGILGIIVGYLSKPALTAAFKGLGSIVMNSASNIGAIKPNVDGTTSIKQKEVKYATQTSQMEGIYSQKDIERVAAMAKNVLDLTKTVESSELALTQLKGTSLLTEANFKSLEGVVFNAATRTDIVDGFNKLSQSIDFVDEPARKRIIAFNNLLRVTPTLTTKLRRDFISLENTVRTSLENQTNSLTSNIKAQEESVRLLTETLKNEEAELNRTANAAAKFATVTKTLTSGLSTFIPVLTSGLSTATEQTSSFGDVFKAVGSSVLFMMPMMVESVTSFITAIGAKAGLAAALGGLVPIIAAVVAALTVFAVKAISDSIVTVEEMSEAVTNMNNNIKELQERKKTVGELSSEFEALSKIVKKTSEETDRYYEIQNQLAELFPDLILYIDENGNKILDLAADYDVLTKSIEDSIKAEKDSAAQTVSKGFKKLSKDYGNAQEDLYFAESELETYKKNSEQNIKDGFLSEEQVKASIQSLTKNYREAKVELEKYKKSVDEASSVILNAEEGFSTLSAAGKTFATDLYSRMIKEQGVNEINYEVLKQIIEQANTATQNFNINTSDWGEKGSENLKIVQIQFSELKNSVNSSLDSIDIFKNEMKETGDLSYNSLSKLIDIFDPTIEQINTIREGGMQSIVVFNELEQKQKQKLIDLQNELTLRKSNLEIEIRALSIIDPNGDSLRKAALEEINKLLFLNTIEMEKYSKATNSATSETNSLKEVTKKTYSESLSTMEGLANSYEKINEGELLSKTNLLDMIIKYPEYTSQIVASQNSKEKQIELVKTLFEVEKDALIKTKEEELKLLGTKTVNLGMTLQQINAQKLYILELSKKVADPGQKTAMEEESKRLGALIGDYTSLEAVIAGLKDIKLEDLFGDGKKTSSTAKSIELIGKNANLIKSLTIELEQLKSVMDQIDPKNFAEINKNLSEQQDIVHKLAQASREEVKDYFDQLKTGFNLKDIFIGSEKDILGFTKNGAKDLLDWATKETARLKSIGGDDNKFSGQIDSINNLVDAIINGTSSIIDYGAAWKDLQETKKSFIRDDLKFEDPFKEGHKKKIDDLKKSYNNLDKTDFDNLSENLKEQYDLSVELVNYLNKDLKKSINGLNLEESFKGTDLSKFFNISADGTITGWKDLGGFLEIVNTKMDELSKKNDAVSANSLVAIEKFKETILSGVDFNTGYVDSLESIAKALQDTYEDAVDAYGKAIEDDLQLKIDGLEKAISNKEKEYESILDKDQQQIDNFQEKIDLQEDLNRASEVELNLAKAKANLENAKKEKNTRIINEQGVWEWIANPDDVEEAYEELKNAEEEKENYLNEKELNRLEDIKEKHQKELDDFVKVKELEIDTLQNQLTELQGLESLSYDQRMIAYAKFRTDYQLESNLIIAAAKAASEAMANRVVAPISIAAPPPAAEATKVDKTIADYQNDYKNATSAYDKAWANMRANELRGLGDSNLTATSLLSQLTPEEKKNLGLYATGTNKTSKGLFIDGEIGPELRWSNGNDSILPSDLSSQLLNLPKNINNFFRNAFNSLSSSGVGSTVNSGTTFNLSNVTIKADSPTDFIREMQSIANIGFTR